MNPYHVQELKTATGRSVGECVKALKECGGDPERARAVLSPPPDVFTTDFEALGYVPFPGPYAPGHFPPDQPTLCGFPIV